MCDELRSTEAAQSSRSGSEWGCAAWLMLAAVALSGGGCQRTESAATDVAFELRLDPYPPVVGEVAVSLRLTDANGAPVAGAEVRVEGNMNHAGMKPTFGDLSEVEPGRYAGTLPFTMAGDWLLLVTATTPDGSTLDHRIDVPGVRSR